MESTALKKVNVGPNERAASVIGGGSLLLYAVTHPSRLTFPLALSAGYLLYRGLSGNCLVYEVLDIRRARGGAGGIVVHRALTINRPRAEVYRYWRNFENLPNFMSHLESVQVNGDRQSHWVAAAPWDQKVEWDAEIAQDREDELIAWRSLPGSEIQNSGTVEFKDAPGGLGTEVIVSLSYRPPGGSASAALAKLLGEEPGRQVREDLRRFKQVLEAGEAATVTGQTSARLESVEQERENLRRRRSKDIVQKASEESFPASDPPGFTVGAG